MGEYISRKAAIAYIRKQSEECQKAFEELGGESGIYADAYNDLVEDFYSIPAADVAPVVHGMWDSLDGFKTRRVCSVCDWDVPEYGKFYSYCPNCGAKMEVGNG